MNFTDQIYAKLLRFKKIEEKDLVSQQISFVGFSTIGLLLVFLLFLHWVQRPIYTNYNSGSYSAFFKL